jgi:DNA-binding NtrC family response regulator
MHHWNDDLDPREDAVCEGAHDGVRVLLVGDDDGFLRAIAQLFETAGHTTRRVFDARTAIARVGQGHADVVVCDLGAARLQSVATILALRHLGDDAPPVVACSGMPNLVQHCRTLGVPHFVPQPFRFKALLEVVERLGKQHRLDPFERSGVFARTAETFEDELPELNALDVG